MTSAALLGLNGCIVPLKRMAAPAAALLVMLALAPLGVVLHEHDADAQAAGHAGCDACHFRHLSGVPTDGAPAPARPTLVAHDVAPAPPGGERAAVLGTLLTRGPPA